MNKKLLTLIISSLIIGTLWEVTETSAEYSDVKLEAQAALVYDVKENKVLFAHNGHAQLPLASLAKLMTAYSAVLENRATKEELCFMLTASSNEMAETIADRFVSNAGDRMRPFYFNKLDLGLNQTFYLNPTGLDLSSGLAGAYGSAIDQAKLIVRLETNFPELLRCTSENSATFNDITIRNTNPDASHISGLLGSKTGFTDLAGGNLAIIFDAEIAHPIIIVVMGSSEKGRFSDVASLATIVREGLDLSK